MHLCSGKKMHVEKIVLRVTFDSNFLFGSAAMFQFMDISSLVILL